MWKRTLWTVILKTAGSFAQNELSPLNMSGDAEGCRFEDGQVFTPKGFKEAYKQYCELGFTALTSEEEFGGQNMPTSLNSAVSEIIGTAKLVVLPCIQGCLKER